MNDSDRYQVRRARDQEGYPIAAASLENISDQLGYEHAAEGARHTADAYHRGHCLSRKEVRGHREKVGGESLMARGSHSDQYYSSP